MTLDELIARRADYLAAEKAILRGQEYEIGDGVTRRRMRRADLSEVRAAITELDGQIELASTPPVRRRILHIR